MTHSSSIAQQTSEQDEQETEPSAMENSVDKLADVSSANDSVQETSTVSGAHPLPGNRPLTAQDIMDIIVRDTPALTRIPTGKKENVYVVLDNTESMRRKDTNKPVHYWDDCGAWDHTKSRGVKTKFIIKNEGSAMNTLCQVLVKNNTMYRETHEKGKNPLKNLSHNHHSRIL